MVRPMSEQERLERRCANCGDQGRVLARGLCGPCYYWQKNHGTPRPKDFGSAAVKPLRPCRSCGRPSKPLTRGLCRRCYARWHHTGRAERPRKVVAQPPAPPPPEDLFFQTLEEGPPRRWPVREVTGPPGPRQGEVQRLLHQAPLSERERYVLQQVYGLDGAGRRSLGAVADALRITRERVRQLQHQGLKKVRRSYAAQDGPPGPQDRPAVTGEVDAVLQKLARALRAERALSNTPSRGDSDAHTWEAGMIRGLRLGKQAAYDVALAYIDDLRAGKEPRR